MNGALRLKKHGFAITHEEQLYKKMEFKSWASAPRRHDAGVAARDARAGHARGQSGLGATGHWGRAHVSPLRRSIHQQTSLTEGKNVGVRMHKLRRGEPPYGHLIYSKEGMPTAN